jgi:type VI secretion system protein VasD
MSAHPISTPGRPGFLGGAVAALLALALAGCSMMPFGTKETSVEGKITATPTLNADVRSRPSPIVMRVYELAARNAFDTADFVSLYERDKETLAADLVSREEIVLQPGETRDWKKKLAPATKFIAVVAAYREIERANWRTVQPVKQEAVNKLSIRAEDLTIRLVPPAK